MAPKDPIDYVLTQDALKTGMSIPIGSEDNKLHLKLAGDQLQIAFNDGAMQNLMLDTPITIGKAEGQLFALPNLAWISKRQLEIFKDGDDIILRDKGTHRAQISHFQGQKREASPVAAPVVPAAPVMPKGPSAHDIAAEGGSGGGYTDIRKRSDNLDIPLASDVLPRHSSDAEEMLRGGFDTAIARTSGKDSGATLSVAMKTTDGKYAFGHLGDSPIMLMMHNEAAGVVKLVHLIVPHTNAGEELRKDNDISTFSIEKLDDTVCYLHSHGTAGRLIRHLGDMKRPDNIPEITELTRTYETKTIDPADYEKDRFVCKGIMICSDGANRGLNSGDVELDLAELLKRNPAATPQEICKVVCDTSKEMGGSDNITAMYLPGDGLIAMADGNTNSAEVAIAGMEAVREMAGPKEQVSKLETTPDQWTERG